MRLALGAIGGIVALGAAAQSHVRVDTVRAIQPWAPHAGYSFPRLVMTDHPVIADRINRHLCIDFLYADPDTAEGKLFDRVWGDADGLLMPRLNDLVWSVRRPFANVAEVELEAEACGAYCEDFVMHYAFDLRDGAPLRFNSLFSTTGIAMLNDTLRALWAERLGGHAAALEQLLAIDRDADERARLRDELELYRSCLDDRAADPYVMDLVLEPSGIRFFIARCAPHAFRELDELDPVSFVLPYAVCRARMRTERRALFP
jgi:hypothetical protein